jgi:hypothetical protein
MTAQGDGTNTPAAEDRSPTDRADGQRRVPGLGRQSTMPPARNRLWFALILLANFLLVRLLFPGLVEVTGLPPAPPLENRKVSDADPRA